MLYKYITCFILFFHIWCDAINAQDSNQVIVHVVDSRSNRDIPNAGISIVNAKDSVLVQYGWSSPKGELILKGLPKGFFFILVNYPGFAEYTERFELNSSSGVHDFGTVKLSSMALLLQDVVIRGEKNGLVVNGDTLKYSAGTFVIEKNAKVEDLLKQIPGLQIDNYGRITAFGQKVGKVLVDGEEFFGDDPTLVTRNIRGDMVKNIQIYDKKSDQAKFTGIEDGIKTKTINVTLKEDKKKGYFGQLTGAYGTKGYYQEQLMANLFRNKSKFSVFGNMANTGKIGLSSSDNDKYGINGITNSLFSRGILFSLKTTDDDPSIERYNGQGYPVARTAGTHYDSMWNSDKETINANFLTGSLNITGNKNTIVRNELPSNILTTVSDQSFERYSARTKLDVTYTIKIDTTSSLKVSIDGALKKSRSSIDIISSALRGDSIRVNSGIRSLSNLESQDIFNASQFYSKKLGKPRRTISLQLNQSFNTTGSSGYLDATNDFYSNNQTSIYRTDQVHQYKTWSLRNQIFGGNLSYTEPITRTISLISGYGIGINRSVSDRRSFNRSTAGDYDLIDYGYSNNYDFREFNQRAEVSFNYNKGKQTIQIGNEISSVNFSQFDRFSNTGYRKEFINWLPSAIFIKSVKQQTFRFDYRGSTIQPTIDQIQTARTNDDPLNIVIGNPDIHTAYKHALSLYFVTAKSLSKRSIMVNMKYAIVNNPIVNNITTDAEGRTTYQAINFSPGNNESLSFEGTYNKTIKSLDLNTVFALSFYNTIDYGVSNNEVNRRNAQTYAARLYFFKYKLKKYNFSYNFRPSYTRSQSTLGKQFDNNGFGLTNDLSLTVNLPKKIELATVGSYTFQAATNAFDQDYKLLLVNAALSKKFFEKENLKLSVTVNDIFNRNIGFNRSALGTTLVQNSYSTIRRYLMFSLSWDLSKFGTLKTE
jgi:hypothetical protein